MIVICKYNVDFDVYLGKCLYSLSFNSSSFTSVSHVPMFALCVWPVQSFLDFDCVLGALEVMYIWYMI